MQKYGYLRRLTKVFFLFSLFTFELTFTSLGPGATGVASRNCRGGGGREGGGNWWASRWRVYAKCKLVRTGVSGGDIPHV